MSVETDQDNYTDTEDVNHLTKNAHKYADGVPLMSIPNELEKCDTCLTCKMRKAIRGKCDTREDAAEIGQGVNILLQHHGYNVRPTAPDASYQNTPVERPHQTITNVIRTIPEGSNLPE
eukprot:13514692-Ditylum_brightwellii.AAC.1